VQVDALEVAVEGHHVARADEVQHQLDLLGVAVARGVDGSVAGRDDVAADVVEAVHRVVDRALVARDRRGREDDRVPVVQLDLRVVAVRHPTQRREGLALRAGGDDHELVVREVVDLPRRHELALRHLDVAELAPDVDVLAHRAADERDLAPERARSVDDLLDAVDVRGEAGDDDPSLAAGEDLLQVRPHAGLRRREPGAVDVRRVPAQQQDSLAAQLGQARHVGGLAVDGRLVELVVAGHEHRAQLGREGDGVGVRDRVRQVDQLHRERPQVERLPGLYLLQRRSLELVLVELGARHGDGERAAVDRRDVLFAQLAQDPGQGPEMVLVAVGDDDARDVARAFPQVGEIGQHEVDAHHVGRGKAQPDVHEHDRAVVLDDGHVLADLAQPAEREDTQFPVAHVAATSSSPWRSSMARTAAASSSEASTSGSRRPPTRTPSMFSAAFVQIGLAVRKSVS
jgi:hypothetical protein